jgi:hypothetical protein
VSETSVKARFENYKSRVSESRDEQQDEKGKHWQHGLPLQRTGKMTSPGKRPLLFPERGFKSACHDIVRFSAEPQGGHGYGLVVHSLGNSKIKK